MKILMYAVLGDEKPYIKEFCQQTGHQVDQLTDYLSEKNVSLAKGYDAIVTQQTVAIPDSVYQQLAEFGIKQITIRQVGYDILDLPAIHQAGLRASNVAAYSPRAIAEYTLTQLMNLIRNNKRYYRATTSGDWQWSAAPQGREIHDLTIAVIGAGRIGSALAEMLHALGAKVLAVDPVYHAQNEAFLDYVDLDQALAQADVVTFHTPLNDETAGMADSAFFDKMKAGSYFLNFARGGLVVTDALLANLRSDKLAGAALDVLPNENEFMSAVSDPKIIPADAQALMAMDNVLLSPHVAFYTDLAIKNMVRISLHDAVALANGQKIENEIFD
ncbi:MULTISPECIES: D-2-hydroxyacid dehydrogenase [Oenococcus]|uniref:D-lactate dehydrogenase n=1 Tax=Oenococcus kitaharae DSM 17330 TaxID=1045004 RepID=G9WIU8_9LACO|nr:D-lactate dehydrogenase [Oenococcus kitaharae DSM 17330]OEY81440.1 lactate dehydrogenase [Oenococcus kitaharae]OEY82928.1 lactate dehydrogenase [Oenococcus kitaharae]OEY84528.1 lactate dehydrogenase [Oenococcus kitaharae]